MDTETASKHEPSSTRHERTDIVGFEDAIETPKAPRSRSPSAATTTNRDHTPTPPPTRKHRSRQTSRTTSSSSSGMKLPSSRTSPDTSRPTSPLHHHHHHHHRSRHSSTTSTPGTRLPTTTARLSSYTTTTSTQPLLVHKDIFTHYIHLHSNPFLTHSNPFTTTTTSTTQPRSSSLPSLCGGKEEPRPSAPPRSYSNFVPNTTIDWTLPSTREKEYKRIERDCRGLRGVWRRWWGREDGVGFWEEGKEREGSVRRYRIGGEGEGERGEEKGEEGGKEKRGWGRWLKRSRRKKKKIA
ncbi:MAG: hypothetical protein HETSPECPRED_001040 [Heterodermia speciosa]|uniref:Uncharacterized protein n=1 Tax=Heterodermia speciosa TaxID=116794 RepID=A0A8H3J038_9LECA|nr:MAG: hypothetical protein HETSPECPRED_001040 [Heterodermia speciosa]